MNKAAREDRRNTVIVGVLFLALALGGWWGCSRLLDDHGESDARVGCIMAAKEMHGGGSTDMGIGAARSGDTWHVALSIDGSGYACTMRQVDGEWVAVSIAPR